jgi:MFS family permease
VVRRFIKSQAKENIGMTTEQSQAEAGEYKGFWKIAEKTALMPSSIVLLIGASSTALMMFIPLYAKTAGIPGVGQFYTAVAVCVFVMCLWVGRIVDKFGSLPVLIPAFLLYALSFGYLLFGGTNFLIAGVLWGVGASCTTSPIFAMVVKRAPKVRMGLATGTFLFANSLGLGLGGFIWGFVIQHAGFQWMFEGSVIATVVVIIYTYVACKKMKV